MTTHTATATAGTNIALCKYWGKRDAALNLPAVGSLSMTLKEMTSVTRVEFLDEPGLDVVTLPDGDPDAFFTERVRTFLDLVRARAGFERRARVTTRNNVPTASGLASSASGFAALALAATRAAGLDLSPAELSALARRGSGSAARSIFGGFVEMHRGEKPDGSDAVGETIAEPGSWDVRLVVAVTSEGRKPFGSTAAMEHTARTSPYYREWLESAPADLAEARLAVGARDIGKLGTVAERSCLRMHASAMAADPPILYWNAATMGVIRVVQELRASGIGAWFTVDAGPHVKVLCRATDARAIEILVKGVPGVFKTVVASPGPGARVVEESS